ncbi:MAG TPA: acyl-CoA dehydrogenase family protein, partial [Myxococcota bacterium]|nr:acyl-CoA dehydrogenase family protein [Myxococcota bacterium]
MEIRFSEQDEAFRREAAAWLRDALSGEFAVLRGRGGSGDDAALIDERRAWEKKLASGGFTCIGWPKEHGGRGASLTEQVIFFEEYARAGAPGRLNHMGETLLGPTLIAFGSDAQKRRFLPRIVSGDEIWCQGYSEPNAGSDLANVATRARLEGGEWVIDGQKVWTSWAQWADWCFVVCRSDPASQRHVGLSYL